MRTSRVSRSGSKPGTQVCRRSRSSSCQAARPPRRSRTLRARCAGVFAQIEKALKSAGAAWGNVVQFTTYLVHSQDIARFMQFRLREFPRMFPNGAYPPNTLLIIDRLVGEQYLLEVQTVAAL